MATSTILDLLALGTPSPPTTCSLEIVNPTVFTDSPSGSSQRMSVAQLFQSPTIDTLSVTTSLEVAAAAPIGWTGRSQMKSTADGRILLTDAAGATFDRLLFGGTGAGFPGLFRAGLGMVLQSADASVSATVNFNAGVLNAETAITAGTSIVAGTSITSTGATAGIGYATGAGGSVTQITTPTTAVVINKVCGRITTVAESIGLGAVVSFQVTNSVVVATDVPVAVLVSGNVLAGTIVRARTPAAGSFMIDIISPANTETGTLVIQFTINKAVIT